jgi:anaerobic selenocysteine-containing dehydrogenase
LPTFLEPERGPLRANKSFLKKYPLILSVGNRNLYYTHSQHRQVKALQKIFPEALCELGPQTAREYKVQDGDRIAIERVAEGIVLVPHGWGGEANGNLLTDITCREPIMGYPDQKSLQCCIRKA